LALSAGSHSLQHRVDEVSLGGKVPGAQFIGNGGWVCAAEAKQDGAHRGGHLVHCRTACGRRQALRREYVFDGTGALRLGFGRTNTGRECGEQLRAELVGLERWSIVEVSEIKHDWPSE
jgi:hypothetical protein